MKLIDALPHIDAANQLGREMAENVIDSYDCFDEDDFVEKFCESEVLN